MDAATASIVTASIVTAFLVFIGTVVVAILSSTQLLPYRGARRGAREGENGARGRDRAQADHP